MNTDELISIHDQKVTNFVKYILHEFSIDEILITYPLFGYTEPILLTLLIGYRVDNRVDSRLIGVEQVCLGSSVRI